jgi:hypothetical protein
MPIRICILEKKNQSLQAILDCRVNLNLSDCAFLGIILRQSRAETPLMQCRSGIRPFFWPIRRRGSPHPPASFPLGPQPSQRREAAW